MKYFFSLLMVGVLMIGIKPLNAQSWLTNPNFITESESVEGMSLGNAMTARKGYAGASHYNSAGVYNPFPMISGYLNQNTTSYYNADLSTYNVYAGYYVGKLHFSTDIKVYMVQTPEDVANDRPDAQSYIINTSASYALNDNLSIGFGLNYLHSELYTGAAGPGISGDAHPDDTKLTLDLGAIYKTDYFRGTNFYIGQSFGFSLNDFGKGIKYRENWSRDPLPMKLRLGTTVNGGINKRVFGMKLLTASVSFDLSKVMARVEEKVTQRNGFADTTYTAMPPLKALFKSWNTYSFYPGIYRESYPLSEQILTHLGTEIGLVETLYFRFGYQVGSDLYPEEEFRSFGVGINLGYLQFDYAKFDYKQNNLMDNESRWQVTTRIPLNGKRPKSVLNQFLN